MGEAKPGEDVAEAAGDGSGSGRRRLACAALGVSRPRLTCVALGVLLAPPKNDIIDFWLMSG